MRISILMPTYNCPPDLFEKALVSVFKQTYTDWEIVIKDGNIDQPAISSQKLNSLITAPSSKIKYFVEAESADRENHQNSYYDALNWCIENSTGDILTVLASDDERGGGYVLEHVNSEFENLASGPFCLYGACEWVNRAGEHICFKQPPVLPVTFNEILRDFPFYTPAVFWNRAIHEEFGLYDAKNYPWSADLDFWLKTWRGIDSKFTPEVIGKYRQWEASQQRNHGDLAGQEGSRILEKWRALR
jgi:glycosyltransferase involved in cell wall biosynthesis